MVHPIPDKKRQAITETNDFWRILGFLGVVFGDFNGFPGAKLQKSRFLFFF